MEADDRADDVAEDCASEGRTETVGEDAEEAERAFVAGLIARGDAAPADEQGNLPPGATHELIEGDDGTTTVRRRRFSAF